MLPKIRVGEGHPIGEATIIQVLLVDRNLLEVLPVIRAADPEEVLQPVEEGGNWNNQQNFDAI
jgi:hypothetical protein